MSWKTLLLLGCLSLVSCSKGSGSTLRSPALDYQPPPPDSEGDGQVVGADGMAPGDKLQQGVSNAGPAPGWSADKSGPAYDPKKRVGGAIDPPPGANPSQK